MVLIAQPANAQFPTPGIDPILFLQDLLQGFIYDENGNVVPIATVFPKDLKGIPRVVVNAKEEEMKFISIPAIRRRWTAPFTMEVWALSVKQRYAIKQSLMARMDTLTGDPRAQLADNYVYMWFKVHEPKDQPRRFGQPIFTIGFTVNIVYDTLTGSVPPW